MNKLCVGFHFVNVAPIKIGRYKVPVELVLSGTSNLKSVRFFKMVLQYDYS